MELALPLGLDRGSLQQVTTYKPKVFLGNEYALEQSHPRPLECLLVMYY